MGRVVAGLRPEWPSDNPPQGLVDELREPVEACWNQEPNDRPTAFMVLQSLQARSKASEMEYANGDLEEGESWVSCNSSGFNFWLVYSCSSLAPSFDTPSPEQSTQERWIRAPFWLEEG